ncbi:DUF3558 domain-containing protein [Amycolatopsis vastitatis]|uniref:DUF3558 domain-containing protein n=1 Tax=Amycolatopsis vastitatis TaxID=1905142 RepID=A0A229T599_9PSEU|nr:DUF3558 domain-containing protein [Amycolatopsis vastitatis]OXM66402.1 hypothetical protein CF165_19955 [Amycolatopsis vastitatis]
MHARVLLAIGITTLLAGCSPEVAGTPSPAVSASTSSVPDGVPRVERPLDTSKFEKDPCSALTVGQLSQLGITTEPKPMPEDKLGPSCDWNAYDEIGLTVGARLLTIGSSLANLYKQHEQGELPLFQPVVISGYPGILVDLDNAKPQGKCSAEVGVRDDLLYSVQVTISSDAKDYADPCPVAKKAAELAVSTMKGS